MWSGLDNIEMDTDDCNYLKSHPCNSCDFCRLPLAFPFYLSVDYFRLCCKCFDNTVSLVNIFQYEIQDRWCDFCINNPDDKTIIYASNPDFTNVKMCLRCRSNDVSFFKERFEYIPEGTVYCDRSSEGLFVSLAEVVRDLSKLPDEIEITEQMVADWVGAAGCLVEIPENMGSLKGWVLIDDIYDLPGIDASTSFLMQTFH